MEMSILIEPSCHFHINLNRQIHETTMHKPLIVWHINTFDPNKDRYTVKKTFYINYERLICCKLYHMKRKNVCCYSSFPERYIRIYTHFKHRILYFYIQVFILSFYFSFWYDIQSNAQLLFITTFHRTCVEHEKKRSDKTVCI